MEKESIEKARELCIAILDKSDIKNQDKVELLLNIYHFLDSNKYEKNIKILMKEM